MCSLQKENICLALYILYCTIYYIWCIFPKWYAHFYKKSLLLPKSLRLKLIKERIYTRKITSEILLKRTLKKYAIQMLWNLEGSKEWHWIATFKSILLKSKTNILREIKIECHKMSWKTFWYRTFFNFSHN